MTEPKPYEPPEGFHIVRLYPADWDSAIAELWWSGVAWACVSLRGVDDAAEGKARTKNAEAVVEFYGPTGEPGVWDFPFGLDEAMEQLREARAWVFENEEGRQPLTDDSEPMTRAGAAFSTMSDDEQRRWMNQSRQSGKQPDS